MTLAKSKSNQIRRARRLPQSLGLNMAKADEARTLLALKERHTVGCRADAQGMQTYSLDAGMIPSR